MMLIYYILHECGLLKSDKNCIRLELRKILLEEKEDYLDYIKIEKDSIVEKIFSK